MEKPLKMSKILIALLVLFVVILIMMKMPILIKMIHTFLCEDINDEVWK